jgi:hypothetical protein
MTPFARTARIDQLHREALHLIRDGLCAAHVDRALAELADNDRLATPSNDTGEWDAA